MSLETQHSEHKVLRSSTDKATDYVRRMITAECRGWGDQANAMSRIEQKYGLPYWTLDHLRTGRAKTVEAGLFARIRAAYLGYCEHQVARLQHEIAIEKALYEDDTLENLEAEASALASKIAEKKAKRKEA